MLNHRDWLRRFGAWDSVLLASSLDRDFSQSRTRESVLHMRDRSSLAPDEDVLRRGVQLGFRCLDLGDRGLRVGDGRFRSRVRRVCCVVCRLRRSVGRCGRVGGWLLKLRLVGFRQVGEGELWARIALLPP